MAGAAVQRRLTWLVAEVVDLIEETATVRTVVFEVPGWAGHLPGQHVDVRLTAEDGYRAQRSYSISAPEEGTRVEITVERVEDGEVSPFLVEDLLVGDRIELRGPIGGYFVWEPGRGEPVQLIGGGAGVAPLMAMVRAWAAAGTAEPMALLYSARSESDIVYRAELDAIAKASDGIEVTYILTRSWPPGWDGFTKRVDREILEEVAIPPHLDPTVFVCGPTGFVETVASVLVDSGHRPDRIRTERFGPTGEP